MSLSPDKFEEYNTLLQNTILNPTKLAFSLPTDIAFHRSVDRDLAKDLDSCSAKVLSITNKLLALTSSGNAGGKEKARLLETKDEVVDNFHSVVVDAMDQLLEQTDICLDEFLGRSKAPAIAVNVQTDANKTSNPRTNQGRLDPALQHASHLPKPQLKFKQTPNNDRNFVWQPTLKHKYNAQVPLGYDFQDDDTNMQSTSIPHPYRYEITHTVYPPRMFRSITPIRPGTFEQTPLNWISTVPEFQLMLNKLRNALEIAVDLEHHSYRSFNGFVCLMQITTREEDFIVDTLCLREELEELNEIFTNPGIVKVFHGAESDITWLEQNFNIYVVNLFDTFHASKVLEFPRHGLAALLEMYCDLTPDKRYQLADWRIRPLPQEMLSYARSDTHFLLYIYDNLRNALLDRAMSRTQSPQPSSSDSASHDPVQALVREVLLRSRETSLRLCEQEVYDAGGGSGPGGWDCLAKKWNKTALMAGSDAACIGNGLAREVYKCVHDWRDRTAREEDESTRYVLPNHYLFRLAEQPPVDLPGLLNLFPSVPPVIKRKAKDLLIAIKNSVKRHLGPRNVENGERGRTSSATTKQAVETSLTGAVHTDSALWSKVPPVVIKSPSTLFESSDSGKQPHKAYVASKSLLFGAQSSPLSNEDKQSARFQTVKVRIHSALAITPAVPTSVPAEPTAAGPDDQDVPNFEPPSLYDSEQIEIPYVPASERRRVAEPAEDSIVVVGQQTRQQKKRKRTKVKTSQAAEETEVFDYSTVPNILDANPHERADPIPKKKQRGGGFQYGDFPAPPKASSAPKSGNKSHTFK